MILWPCGEKTASAIVRFQFGPIEKGSLSAGPAVNWRNGVYTVKWICKCTPLMESISLLVGSQRSLHRGFELNSGKGEAGKDQAPFQHSAAARAAWHRSGRGCTGPTKARPAMVRGSHEALRARRRPVVGCIALWSDGDL